MAAEANTMAMTQGMDGMTNGMDGMTHGMDGMTHGMDGMTHGMDGMTHGMDGMTHGIDGMTHGTDHGNHESTGHLMVFSFNLPIQVLFYGWNVKTQGELAASCIGVLLFAMCYEGLKALRQYIYRRKQFTSHPRRKISMIFNGWHMLQAILHCIQVTLGMLIMLVYMTFNVWLAVSVSIGSGLGYLVFSWGRVGVYDEGDHCV